MISGLNRRVTIDGVELNPAPSQALVNHSPDGFAWGYAGSGPSQLALALLLHFTNDPNWSRQHYQDFKFDVIAGLPMGAFQLADAVVTKWIRQNRAAEVAQ